MNKYFQHLLTLWRFKVPCTCKCGQQEHGTCLVTWQPPKWTMLRRCVSVSTHSPFPLSPYNQYSWWLLTTLQCIRISWHRVHQTPPGSKEDITKTVTSQDALPEASSWSCMRVTSHFRTCFLCGRIKSFIEAQPTIFKLFFRQQLLFTCLGYP